jgi:drug/metabolite transporter (DMT)-like permease
VQRAIEGVSTVAFVQLRFLIASVVLLPFLLRGSRIGSAIPAQAVIPGLLLAAGFLLQTEGLRTVRPSVSAFLTATSVIMVPLFAGLLGWEKPNLRRSIAVAFALIGVFLLQGMRLPASWSEGESWTFLCAVAFAGQIVVLGRVAPRSGNPVGLALGQILVATVVLVLLGLLRGTMFVSADLSPKAWLAVIFAGALATAGAFLVQTWAQRKAPAGHVAVCFASEPVFATLFSISFFGDRLPLWGWVGAVTVLIAVGLVATEGGRSPLPD